MAHRPQPSSAFQLSVSCVATPTEESSKGSSTRRINVCARYDGPLASSKMAGVELSHFRLRGQ